MICIEGAGGRGVERLIGYAIRNSKVFNEARSAGSRSSRKTCLQERRTPAIVQGLGRRTRARHDDTTLSFSAIQ